MVNLNKKCPNCGAIIEHNYNHKCPYCRNYLHVTDDEIKKINNCDYKIAEIIIDNNPLRHSYILTILGYTTPKLKYYEENINGDFIISGSDIMQKVGYNIELPYELVCDINECNLIDYVLNSIPPELCNKYNEYKIITEIYEFLLKVR